MKRNRSSIRRFAGHLVAALACSFLIAQYGSAQSGEIHWYKTLGEAIAVAQQTNQPIMIDFWADWCGPCKIMDAEVYSDPALVAAFREKMIGARIHFDLQPEMARKFEVPALPYLVFTSSNGTELLSHRGLLEAKDMTTVINAFPADLTEINRLDRILVEDKNHFPAMRDLGQKLREMGFYKASSDFYERALRHNDAKRNDAQRETILYSMALNALALQDGGGAASSLERCLKDFSKSSRRPDFLLGLGRAYILKEEPARAKRSLDQVVREFPQSPAAEAARKLLSTL
jgi:thiol-disulfide isomerase/thioredoxin